MAGKEESYRRAEPILKDLTLSLRYIGGPGKAAELKALVNMVMNINTVGLAEGLGLAEALGLDLKVVKEVFSQTGANSRVLETDGPDMLDREHSTFFSASHAAKDSGIALELAETAGSLPAAPGGFKTSIRSNGQGGSRGYRQIGDLGTDLQVTEGKPFQEPGVRSQESGGAAHG